MKLPVLLRAGVVEDFPDPTGYDGEGLVAVGGDLSVERLLLAYDHGIFPWFGEDNPELWWCPDPRAVIVPEELHVSRSMVRFLRNTDLRVTWDRVFRAVMVACNECRPDGVWILPQMIEAYTELHARGHAHSVEIWRGEELVGGLYGVHRGGVFAGESMFHRVTNASKFALIELIRTLHVLGVELIDVQILTDHLASMGARHISRRDYLAALRRLRRKDVRVPNPAPDGPEWWEGV